QRAGPIENDLAAATHLLGLELQRRTRNRAFLNRDLPTSTSNRPRELATVGLERQVDLLRPAASLHFTRPLAIDALRDDRDHRRAHDQRTQSRLHNPSFEFSLRRITEKAILVPVAGHKVDPDEQFIKTSQHDNVPGMLNGLVPPLITAAAAALLLWFRRIYVRRGGRQWQADLVAAIGIVCVTALLELAMGRTLTYRNGPIRPWVSEVHSDQNSQQVSDWYTFSHIIHGALFYGVTHLTMGPASV